VHLDKHSLRGKSNGGTIYGVQIDLTGKIVTLSQDLGGRADCRQNDERKEENKTGTEAGRMYRISVVEHWKGKKRVTGSEP